ncbi:MAG: PD-(D/E)XK nuclease family protein [Nitrospinota bacterium]|nr:PD-(D/E)XK nuclease family protein [Nitrospinota bacterium]
MDERLHVYPTRLKVEEVEAERYRSAGAVFSKHLISIFELEGRLARDLVPYNPISEVERWLLINQSIISEKSLGRDRAMAPLISSDGFVRSVGELIQQIKLGLVDSADLEKINGFAPGKEGWIKKVFAAYQKLLRTEGLYDSADISMELVKKLHDGVAPPAWLRSFSGIDFFDIYHYTPFRFEMITRLAEVVNIVVHFPLPDERRKAFDFVERDIQKFQSLAGMEGKLELAFDSLPGDDPGNKKKTALDILAGQIFSEEAGDAEEEISDSVEVVKNSGRYREIEEVASRIMDLKESRRSWSDFCLVFRQTGSYANIVEDVFRRAGIPVYIRRGLPVKNNLLVKTILGIFRIIETGYDRDEIVKLMTSDYFDIGLSREFARYLEKIFMDAGIISGPPSLLEKKCAAYLKRGIEMDGVPVAAETVDDISAGLKKVFSILKEVEKLSRASKAGETIAIFRKLLKIFSPRAIQFGFPFFTRDLFCKGRFYEVVEEAENAVKEHKLGESRFGWGDLRRLLFNSLGNAELPEWSEKNHVYALNIHELAGRRFPYIFVCGLHDGEFPLKSEHGAVLSESEKKLFNEKHSETVLARMAERKMGRQVFSRLGETWDEESFLFFLAVRSAREKIYFSYSTHDLNGKELGKSTFLYDIKTVLPALAETATRSVALEKGYFEQIDHPAREAKLLRDIFNTPEENAGALADYYRSVVGHPVTGKSFINSCERSMIERERDKFYSSAEPDVRANASSVYTGKVGEMPLLSGYVEKEARKGFSATAIERFANCAFRYFMDRPLQVKPQELPRADIERTVKGSIAHEILEIYYAPKGKFKVRSSLEPRNAREKRLNTVAEKVFAKWEKSELKGEPAIWEITKEQIRRALSLYLRSEETAFEKEPFTVVATELKFGPDEPFSVSLKLPGGEMSFNGLIDRIDLLDAKGMLRVVDYKYSSNTSKFSKLVKSEKYGEESFQVPVYLLAALNLAERKEEFSEIKTAVASYITLKKEPKESAVSPTASLSSGDGDFSFDNAEFLSRFENIRTKMNSGDFSVTPKDCVFCKYRRACRYREVMSVELGE